MPRAFLLVVLCGCASAGTSEQAAEHQPAVFVSDQGTLLGERPHATTATIAASPAAVWLAIRAVHAEFAIPVTVENAALHQIGNPSFYKTRSLAGQPMSEFVDCGSGIDGPKAASYRIYISLLTIVTDDGKGGTTVQTTFIPVGQDMTGGSSDRITCGTSGRFEQLFLDHVKAAIGKG
jgi:hypothetical protein